MKQNSPKLNSYLIIVFLSFLSFPLEAQVHSLFKTEPGTNRQSSEQDDAIYSNGYYYLSGSSDDNYYGEPAIVKTDTSGHLIWTTTDVNPAFKLPTNATDYEYPVRHLFLLSDGLYGINFHEIWKVDTMTGIILWKQPKEGTVWDNLQFLQDWDADHFLVFRYGSFQIRNKTTGEVEKTLTAGIHFSNYCLDDQLNFYVIYDKYIAKYDSSFAPVWTTLTNNTEIADIFYHTGTHKLIMTVDGWPRVYTADPETGAILTNQKLYTIPRENERVSVADLNEPDAVYLAWKATTDLEPDGFGFLVTKLNPATGQLIFNKGTRINGVSASCDAMKIKGNEIYVTGFTDEKIADVHNIALLKLDKNTGDSIYAKELFNKNLKIYRLIHDMQLLDQHILIPIHWHSYLDQYQTIISSLMVFNDAGDSLHHYTYPGRLQYLTRTEHLFYLDSNKILAVSQMATSLDVTVLDYNFKYPLILSIAPHESRSHEFYR
jgi:hypothetical protein